jgi:regulator of replication initiation timing
MFPSAHYCVLCSFRLVLIAGPIFVQVQEMEETLNKLRSGVTLVKPEDKEIIENSFSEKVNQWKKRKRMFKELWDNITENSPKDQKEFKVLAASPFSHYQHHPQSCL